MSNPIHLFALRIQNVPGSEREAFPRSGEPNTNARSAIDPSVNKPEEIALRSGITSMEHWLDLNA